MEVRIVGIVTLIRDGQSAVRIPLGTRDFFLFFKFPKPALGPTQVCIQWVSGLFPRSKVGVMLTSHLYLVPRLRMSGAVPLRPLQSGPKKIIHSLLIYIFGINLNEISISG